MSCQAGYISNEAGNMSSEAEIMSIQAGHISSKSGTRHAPGHLAVISKGLTQIDAECQPVSWHSASFLVIDSH